ncbi:MAG: AAA family ATPase [Planctomycetes bacterium]|nr:AAA family ATPase [Planctomycetota bacterium]
MAALARVEQRLNDLLLGQGDLIRHFLTGVLAGGHILLEGLPGMGKTRLVQTFCRLTGLSAGRIQFTPDLMPLDITGSSVLQEQDGGRSFVFCPGPIFANLVLADEINRASPKTQAALLEAMQERQVTVLGESHRLPRPFAVLATQNPIELEGTYPLPEAQLDRFLFKLDVGEVGLDELREIASGRVGGDLPEMEAEITPGQFKSAMTAATAIPMSPAVAEYIARIVIATRPGGDGPSAHIRYGASPRAAIGMASAARARAFLSGRVTVGFEDVLAVAPAVLRHRVLLDYRSRLDGYDADRVVAELLRDTPELNRDAPKSLAVRLAGGR